MDRRQLFPKGLTKGLPVNRDVSLALLVKRYLSMAGLATGSFHSDDSGSYRLPLTSLDR